MSFELGIPIPKPLEEQLITTLREYNPALRESSGEEIVRQVEPAEVLGALGTLRRIPVLHQIANLVDPDLIEGFDRESLRKERTVPLQLSEEYLSVAIANPYGNYKLVYERRYPNLPLVPVLTSAAQISGASDYGHAGCTDPEIGVPRQVRSGILESCPGEQRILSSGVTAVAGDPFRRGAAVARLSANLARRPWVCLDQELCRRLGRTDPTMASRRPAHLCR